MWVCACIIPYSNPTTLTLTLTLTLIFSYFRNVSRWLVYHTLLTRSRSVDFKVNVYGYVRPRVHQP